MTIQLLCFLLVLCVVGVCPEQCAVLQEYSHSYPLGKVSVEGIHMLAKNVSLNECLNLCCDEGPAKCQYIWKFRNNCVGMPCINNKTACSPQTFEKLSSILVVVKYNNNNNIEIEDQTTPASSDVIVQPSPAGPVFDELANELSSSSSQQLNIVSVSTTSSQLVLSTLTSQSANSSSASTSILPSSSSSEVKASVLMTSVTSLVKSSSSVVPTPTSHAKIITVATDAINKTKEITLPVNSVKIFASTWPELSTAVKYDWQWTQLFGPSEGFLSVVGEKEADLTGLVQGVYGIKVSVTGDDGSYGETCVNVTVLPAPRMNTPPHPVITPSNHLLLHLPTDSAILEATGSTDDYEADKMTYKWEEISGPLETRMPPSYEQILYLKDLIAGTYIIKLTVTDVDGASNFTTANITVLASVDNPPIANAGDAQKLVWPHDHVVLYGNASFDDNGIVTYNWKKSVGPGVDMQGSFTPILVLNRLQKGDYVFTLTVTDGSKQQSTAEVSVAVVEEANKPPVANAGSDQTISWPMDSVTLDGSSSSDDQDVVQYHWTLVRPVGAIGQLDIEMPRGVSTNVTRLCVRGKSPTVYEFNLTVTDQHNLTSWDSVLVTVTKDASIPPTIVVTLQVEVSLPQHLVVLNASRSHDDFGIASYQWMPYPQNLAIGEMMSGSEHSAVLYFTNFVEGVYLFNLTVHNTYHAHSSAVVNVTVLPDVHEKNLVQLFLADRSVVLTLAKLTLLKEMIRNEMGTETKVIVQETRQLLSNTVVEFYVLDTSTDKPFLATRVVNTLDESNVFKKLNDEFSIKGMETKVCQTNCSGHGVCDYYSKTCRCKPGWMANPFRSVHGKKGLNCDWSILYLVIILLAPVLVSTMLVWLICCCCYKRQKRVVSNRRVRYALLPEDSRSSKSSHHTVNTSIMVSESETEEEILFDKKSKKKIKNNNLSKYGSNAQLINPAKLQ